MQIIEDALNMQTLALSYRSKGKRIGFVPTMGALHKGHESLLRLARSQCDILVCSIYVNPLQFGANEDLDQYPHSPELDHEICQVSGVDIVFRPSTLYSSGHSTFVHVEELSDGLCGRSRPTHFDGVTTVVARLFGLVQPNMAVFGEKDFQQLAIIRRMVSDLALPIQVIGGPIVREEDGLALSSRNMYLSKPDRLRAHTLSHTLNSIQEFVWTGVTDTSRLYGMAHSIIDVDSLDYLEFVDSDTLNSVTTITNNTRILIAAFLGETRLIDNIGLSLEK
jgi:pantoate--beta-alanine ligase